MTENPSERISGVERREQILAAASLVFGERGYAGATTDQVAQAAGISQPYVVRMFGSKENLFLEVLDRALDRLTTTFRAALADDGLADEEARRSGRIGAAYADLIRDRGILLSLMQAFTMGGNPTIGAKAREGFLAIFDLLRDEAGMSAEHATDFLAHGMLFNTMVALRMPEQFGASTHISELLQCTFGEKLRVVIDAVDTGDSRRTAVRA